MNLNPKYKLEFILHTYGASLEAVRSSLAEFGEGLEISEMPGAYEKSRDFNVNMNTGDPTIVFDVCSQLGRIRSVKVEDEGGV